ncbi:unnamed protein product [Mesocestoides corti]|uniref:YLP motif-containing protein 1 n=1 Tax=Mesocestoides corti TaxID=53468 RepID=A0A0R3UNH9_MESCO|nr:unnamed protein product [Mesocestoides corti]
MQYGHGSGSQNGGVPRYNQGAGFYPVPPPPPPDPSTTYNGWQTGPTNYGCTWNPYSQEAPQRLPPPRYPPYSGTQSTVVPQPVQYPNVSPPPGGPCPNPPFDRDYRQFSVGNVEHRCLDEHNQFNNGQGTYYSQPHHEFPSNLNEPPPPPPVDSGCRQNFPSDRVIRSSWEDSDYYSGQWSESKPQDHDWRDPYSHTAPEGYTAWANGRRTSDYLNPRRDRFQDDWKWRDNQQSPRRERSRSPQPGRSHLEYTHRPFWQPPGGYERQSSVEHVNYHHHQSYTNTPPKQRPMFAVSQDSSSQRIASEAILANPGRKSRPPKILIILRGLPGSGKSTLARLIKEKETQAAEAEGRTAAVRLLSMDDFFVNEEGNFVYESEMDEAYRKQLVKLVCRQMDNGLFTFLVVDAVNHTAAELEELAAQARTRHFQVYIIEVTANLGICINRSAGRRSESDILALQSKWEPTPCRYTIIDANSLQQEVAAEEVDMEADSGAEDAASPKTPPPPPPPPLPPHPEANCGDDDDDEDDDSSGRAWGLFKSKWDKDEAVQRLGEILEGNTSPMPLDLKRCPCVSSHCRTVTWADIEALRENSRRRELGFVVGQTDWSQMTESNDEKIASAALTRTKYF